MKATGKVRILDIEDGEELGVAHEGDSINITRAKSTEAFRNRKADNVELFNFKYNKFVMMNDDEFDLIMGDLSKSELVFLISISKYIGYSNSLEFNNHVCMGTEDLVSAVKLSRNEVYTVIRSLTQKDILHPGKNSKGNDFHINPWLYHRGETINKGLKSMFRSYKIRSKNGIEWGKLNDNIPM